MSRSLTIRRESVKLAVLVDHRDLRAAAVQVDADPTRSVIHGRSSSRIVRPRGRNPRGLELCSSGPEGRPPATRALGARAAGARPPLHDIKGGRLKFRRERGRGQVAAGVSQEGGTSGSVTALPV